MREVFFPDLGTSYGFPDSYTDEQVDAELPAVYESIKAELQRTPIKPEKPASVASEFGKGLAHGAINTAKSFATLTEAAGSAVGSETLEELGQKGEDYFSKAAEPFAPAPEDQGSLVEEYRTKGAYSALKKMLDASRLAGQIGEMIVPVGTMLIPAGAITKIGTAAKLSERSLYAARALTTMLTAGTQEGAQSYEEALQRTGDEGKALAALGGVTVATGLLNAAGLEAWIRPLALKGLLSKLGHVVASGSAEAVTEWLEEPATSAVYAAAGVPDDWKERALAGFDVMAPSFLLGGAGSAVSQAFSGETPEAVTPTPTPPENLEPDPRVIREQYQKQQITAKEALDAYTKVQGVTFTPEERDLVLKAANVPRIEIDTLFEMIGKRKAGVTQTDVEWLAGVVDARNEGRKKKQIFSTQTALEQKLREKGVKIEGDEYESAFSPENRQKLWGFFKGESEEAFNVHVAFLDYMVRNALPSEIDARAFMDDALFDITTKDELDARLVALRQDRAAKQVLPDTKVVDTEGYPKRVTHITLNPREPGKPLFSKEYFGQGAGGNLYGTGFYFGEEDTPPYHNRSSAVPQDLYRQLDLLDHQRVSYSKDQFVKAGLAAEDALDSYYYTADNGDIITVDDAVPQDKRVLPPTEVSIKLVEHHLSIANLVDELSKLQGYEKGASVIAGYLDIRQPLDIDAPFTDLETLKAFYEKTDKAAYHAILDWEGAKQLSWSQQTPTTVADLESRVPAKYRMAVSGLLTGQDVFSELSKHIIDSRLDEQIAQLREDAVNLENSVEGPKELWDVPDNFLPDSVITDLDKGTITAIHKDQDDPQITKTITVAMTEEYRSVLEASDKLQKLADQLETEAEEGPKAFLKSRGYDGITHIGDSGNRRWIAWEPDQFVLLWKPPTEFPELKGLRQEERPESLRSEESNKIIVMHGARMYDLSRLKGKELLGILEKITKEPAAASEYLVTAPPSAPLTPIEIPEKKVGKLPPTGKGVKGDIVAISVSGKKPKAVGIQPKSSDIKYLIRALNSPDFSTAVHEFAHFLVLTSQGDFRTILEMSIGKPIEKWTTTVNGDHERFALGFEKFLLHHQARSVREALVFEWAKTNMARTVNGLVATDVTAVPEEFLTAYRVMLHGSDSGEFVTRLQEVVWNHYQGLQVAIAQSKPLELPAAALKQLRQIDMESMAEFFEEQRGAHEDLSAAAEFFEKQKKSKFEVGFLKGQVLADDPDAVMQILERFKATGAIQPHELIALSHILNALDEFTYAAMKLPLSDKSMEIYRQFAGDIHRVFVESRSNWGRFGAVQAMITAKIRMTNILKGIEVAGVKMTDTEKMMLQQAIDRNDAGTINFLADVLQERAANKDKTNIGLLLTAFYYNGLLSNPGTHLLNVSSNFVWLNYLALHRGAVGFVDWVGHSIGLTKTRTTMMGEAFKILKAIYTAPFNKEALRQARLALDPATIGIDTEALTKWNEETSYVRTYLNLEHFGGKRFAKTMTIPTRWLAAADIWFKSIAEEAHDNAIHNTLSKLKDPAKRNAFCLKFIKTNLQSVRLTKVKRDALELPLGENGEMRPIPKGFNITEWLAEDNRGDSAILANLDDWLLAATENSKAIFAEHATFQDEPGNLTRSLANARSNFVGRMFVPFVATIANIAKRGAELTPGLGIVAGRWSKRSILDITTKQIEAAMIYLVVGSLIEAGKITGPPPEDKARREAFYRQGKLPFAVNIGGVWIDYRRFDPLGIPLGVITTLWEKLQDKIAQMENPAIQPASTYDLFLSGVLATRDYFVDSTFLQGFSKIVDGEEWDFGRQIAWSAGSMVPYSSLWRTLKRSQEAWTTGFVEYKEDSYMWMFAQGLPPGSLEVLKELGYITEPDAKITVFGEENKRASSFFQEWLPTQVRIPSMDPVELALQELSVYPGMPGRVVTWDKKVGRERIPDDFYRDHVLSYGKDLKARFDSVIRSREWTRLSDKSKLFRLEKIMDRTSQIHLRRLKARLLAARRRGEI